MEQSRTQAAWSSLDTLLTAGALGSLSDGQLLDPSVRPRRGGPGSVPHPGQAPRGDGPGILPEPGKGPHEAEDAFQATFLVLVRRADSIRQRETIAPWLYGVTPRVARHVRIRSARRRNGKSRRISTCRPGRRRPRPRAQTRPSTKRSVACPSRSAPLILCCLEGQSYDLAARLGLREPTLRGRCIELARPWNPGSAAAAS